MGDGTTVDKSTPIQVHNLNNVTAISAGRQFSLALKEDGSVWGWGNNNFGQLGDGTKTNRSLPVQALELTNVISISTGDYHSIALRQFDSAEWDGGLVWTWGRNNYGQLGDGTGEDNPIPSLVEALGTANSYYLISAGNNQSFAYSTYDEGRVWAWGSNTNGLLCTGDDDNRLFPVESLVGSSTTGGVIGIATGKTHSIFLTFNELVGCGSNEFGQLGNGTFEDSFAPVVVQNLTDNVSSISAGEYHSLAIAEDHSVWVWGKNNLGQLGDGTYENRSTPYKLTSISQVFSIEAGLSFSGSLNIEDGSVFTWGSNNYGQLGDGTTTSKNYPVNIDPF